MQEFYLPRINETKEKKEFLEKQLNVKITIVRKKVIIDGDALDEYEASLVFEAIIFGFPLSIAIMLKDPAYSFRELPIKDFTRKNNLEPIRARLIGKYGRTKETIEEISDCRIIIKDNSVGIIGSSDEIQYGITAITNLIKGTKQANVYGFLERINKRKK